MKRILCFGLIGSHALSQVHGAELHSSPSWSPMKAQFLRHSGHATYPESSSATHRAITIAFEGKAARAVFDQMGPDARTQCSATRGDRERRNKGALCTLTASVENTADPHYRCWIGIDLKTGEGNQGVSC
jgi:hypothetical protein